MGYLNAESAAENRARYFKDFARLVCRGSSPLYERLARGVAGDEKLLELASHLRPDQPPNLFFSAVHFLLLKGARHPLANFYESVGGTASAEDADPLPAFRDFCRERRETLIGLISTRIVQTNEIGRYACLVPAFGIVSRMAAGRPLATVEVGASAGLGLLWDKYGYDYGAGGRCGDDDSPVQNFCESRGPLPPPVPRTLPPVASRVGLDLNPLDVRDREAALWLHALVFPEHRGRAERLSRALELARRDPPRVLAGDAAELLASALHEVPEGAPVCVFNSFTLTQLPDAARGLLLRTLAEFGSRRELYHVSLEWFGGEHPLLELSLYDGRARARKLTLASCDAHGGWLHWLDPSQAAPRAGRARAHVRAADGSRPFSTPSKADFTASPET
ncbi:MAG TPA: DUF2332 domain-containing protein [Pyrinomonadaceae bacterium]|jgi:hypothetical protein